MGSGAIQPELPLFYAPTQRVQESSSPETSTAPPTLRLLLGSVGSGKTETCIREIQQALLDDSNNPQAASQKPPLLFLVPRQATFLAEREILRLPELGGFTRLWVVSFERLARRLLAEQGVAVPTLLDEVGKLMLLRAVLGEIGSELRIFRSAAIRPGFIKELQKVLNTIEQNRLSPEDLEKLAHRPDLPPETQAKLQDLARILKTVRSRLAYHQLDVPENLLTRAADLLQRQGLSSPIRFDRIWVDGFVRWTPQQLLLLKALLLHAQEMTVALCLDPQWIDPSARTRSSLAPSFPIWDQPQHGLNQLQELAAQTNAFVKIEVLPRLNQPTRFQARPDLQHLADHWATGRSYPAGSSPDSIQLTEHPHPTAEVTWVARQIRTLTTQNGYRYREIGVLTRSLEDYAPLIARVFQQYEIPFFLDMREPAAHHPVAELTRAALRVVAYGWKTPDLIDALRTGLVGLQESEIDRLEETALERGWDAPAWKGEETSNHSSDPLDRLRQRAAQPFLLLEQLLHSHAAASTASRKGPRLNGAQLAQALRTLWDHLRIERRILQAITALQAPSSVRVLWPLAPQVQRTVLEEMERWRTLIETLFADLTLPLRDWLPVLDIGLSQLSIGVIPPALDQVLIGAVDRSRNPNLKVLFVLGCNEGRFPSLAPEISLLSDAEKETLQSLGLDLQDDLSSRLAREHYLAYIALTRSSEKLFLSYSLTDFRGRASNPSPFLFWLQRLFPKLSTDRPSTQEDRTQRPVHWRELPPLLFQNPSFFQNPPASTIEKIFLPSLFPIPPAEPEALSPEVLEKVFPNRQLHLTATGLETFAACPFRFFLEHILKAQERRLFEIDPLRRGSFLHELLHRLHLEIHRRWGSWREVPAPEEAERLLDPLARELAEQFAWGIFAKTPIRTLQRQLEVELLKRLIRTLFHWFQQGYEFEPWRTELVFGRAPSSQDSSKASASLPPLVIPLEGLEGEVVLTGKIDRIDRLSRSSETELPVVLFDYKTSQQRFDPVLWNHGLQLQLPLYALALENAQHSFSDLEASFSASEIQVIGFFFLPLKPPSASSFVARSSSPSDPLAKAFRPQGVFLASFHSALQGAGLPRRDRSGAQKNAEEFSQLLAQTRQRVAELASRIFEGEIAPNPYKYKNQTPCTSCPWRSVCRIDPIHHPYRRLR